MKWIAPAVAVFVLLAFGGFYLLANQFQARANRQYVASGYASASGTSDPRVYEAEMQGKAGWPTLQKLMVDKDDHVALQASFALTRTSQDEAFDLFFSQLPKTTTFVRESCRSSWFDARVFERAADRIKQRDPETMKGAMLLLKLSYVVTYMRNPNAYNTLVSAIPEYEGAEADDLAYTVSRFAAEDPQPLIDMLDHPSPVARATALKVFAKAGSAEALKKIQALKSDHDPQVRQAALRAEKSSVAAAPRVVYSPMPGARENVPTGDRGKLGMPK